MTKLCFTFAPPMQIIRPHFMYTLLLRCAIASIGIGGATALQAQEIFNERRLHEIHIRFDKAGWYDSLQQYYDAGLAGAEKKTLPAAVIVDGDTLAAPVAMRFKGHYSNYGFPGPKKPFRMHFGKYDDAQDYQGIKKLNLHNLAGDPSFLREHIAYGFLRQLGLPASRAAFTRLFINGRYWGCYLVVEEPEDKAFLKHYFQSDKGNLFDAAETTDLAWVDSLPASYPELELQSKDKEGAWKGLISWLYLVNKDYSLDYDKRLDRQFAVDAFLKTLAADMLMDNWDSYAANGRNFYLYDHPEDGKIHWIPWDYNLAFWYKNLPPFPKDGKGRYRPLVWRILDNPYLKARYLDIMCQVMAEAGAYPVEAISREAADLIRTAVEEDSLKFYTDEAFLRNRTEPVTVNMLRDTKPKDITLPGPAAYFRERSVQMQKTLLSMDCNCDEGHNGAEPLQHIILYPNPAKNTLNIYGGNRLLQLEASITTTAGTIIRRETIQMREGKALLDITALPAGIYWLNLYTSKKQKSILFSKS